MLLIDQAEEFIKNGEFELIKENKKNFLINKLTKGRVEIDEIGRKVFDQLPSSLKVIKRNLETEQKMIIPDMLLYFYLLVFWKSDLIKKKKERKKLSFKKNHKIEKKYKISIVIVTYNGEEYVAENLNSLQHQTVLPDEIIVVDNASSDNTLNIIKKYKKKVKLVRNKKNFHYAKGVNIGVKNAKGDIIVILNQDIVLEKTFLEEIIRKYEESDDKENIAAIVPQIRFMKLPGFINSVGNVISNRGWGSDNYFCAVDIGQLKALEYVKSACFGAIVITKSGWIKVDNLDKKYESYYEDVDWSFKAHLKKMKLLVASRAIVYHDFGGSYTSFLKLKLVTRNRLRFVLKNFSGRIMLGFLKNYFKEDISNIFSFYKVRSFRVIITIISGYISLFKQIPNIMFYKFKGNSASRAQIEKYFIENSNIVILSNDKLEPVISKEVIRSYYYFAVKHV